jgi:DNA-directed RNA polymerase II subunit RPB2
MEAQLDPLDDSILWKIIDSYFKGNPQSLVTHHHESYNDFFTKGIYKILKETNPIRIHTNYDIRLPRYNADENRLDPELGLGEYRSQANLYIGGKDGSRLYFGKPVIYDDDREHYMYPNEARLRNMSYSMTIHYDIEVEYIDILREGEIPRVIGAGELTGGSLNVEDGDDDDDDNTKSLFKTNFKKTKGEEIDGGAPKQENRLKKRIEKKAEFTPKEVAQIRQKTAESLIGDNIQKRTVILEKIFLGKFPIMVQSNFCILSGLPKEVRFQMGECRNDYGGYFIIDGKEKLIIPQEKFGDNMMYIRKSPDDKYLFSAEIRSVSEIVSKPIRTLSIRIAAPSSTHSNLNIVVNIPNVRKPVPLFIVFRALGVISDKDIITTCLYDIQKYASMVDFFIPSVHESAGFMSQRSAIQFIAVLTKGKSVKTVLEILSDYFLPHVGETNFIQKAYYLGYMVNRLLKVYLGLEPETNRDNYKYKRLETAGTLLSDLFREFYILQNRKIHLGLEKRLYFNREMYENNLELLIEENRNIFSERIVDDGFRRAFKGNWGSQANTKRIGIVQDLNRLSHNTMLTHLRKTVLPMDTGGKAIGPRLLDCSQWAYFDPIDTDGSNIGLHKHLAISTYITKGISREPVLKWLREKVKLRFIDECSPIQLSELTKVFVNGLWAGLVSEPLQTVEYFKIFRRNALLPIFLSISFDIRQNTIWIYTDEGRYSRPVFYKDSDHFFFDRPHSTVMKSLESGDFNWTDLVCGFNKRKEDANFDPKDLQIYELHELYDGVDKEINPFKIKRFIENKGIVDFIDTSESENMLIALNQDKLSDKMKRFTHLELHESFVLGLMCNLISFPENNPATRNSFSCNQSAQAVSMYHTNHQVRMDKAAVVLNNAQIPIIKTRYMQYINGEENCYGENAIVAIMCYTGYNVEDAMLINESALERGLFRTTYYTTYDEKEEKVQSESGTKESLFMNIEKCPNVIGTKPGYQYDKLDEFGMIREGTEVDDKTVLIGMTTMVDPKSGVYEDGSKTPKKGQLGIVDKSFMTDGEEGSRLAKVRVREMRIPAIGDKMASRNGQKGTVGIVLKETDMPFTRDGIRPDIIINPHAIPSRMTVGQFVECIMGKACVMQGGYGDCTAFNNKGTKLAEFGEILTRNGYHSSGNEILYNGMTGEQLETEIFIGPTYYMRLKHMVKDKVNYRALGPRSNLTRQTVGGRANDGGLRIGEMERDIIIAHGATSFLNESMMERGDKYYMAICNKTGLIAVYNPAKNIFLSPMADGPLKYVGSIAEDNMRIEHITRFGRSFSVICIPYTMKLLIQELQCINVQMRIVTEDNIDQLANMTFSHNISDLTGRKLVTIQTIVSEIKHTLDKTEKPVEINTSDSSIEEDKTPESPAYAPESPAYAPGSPAYASGSPAYITDLPLIESPTGSPQYNPNTPPDSGSLIKEAIEEEKGIRGGGNINMDNPAEIPEYMVGQQVMLRGGNKGTSTIISYNDPYYTIQSDQPQSLENFKDAIAVVTKDEIYPAMNQAMNLATQYPTGQPQLRYPIGQSPFPMEYPTQQPLQINIVSGNNSSIQGEPKGNQIKGGLNSSVISEPSKEIVGGKIEEKKEEKSNSIFDFTKSFFIKKTE